MSLSIKNEKINAKFDLVSPLTKVMQSQFDDVKGALVENGLVAEGVANDQLANAINEGCENIKPENIRSNVQIGNVKGKIVSKLEDVDLDNCEVKPVFDFNNTFFASNGVDAYGSYSSDTKKGIYHINLLTGERTQIYTEGAQWGYWYEDSKGNIYVSSGTSTHKGIIYLKGTTAKQIYVNYYKWRYFFEDSKGNLYVSKYSEAYESSGIIYLQNDTAMQITTVGSGWSFKETSKGYVYAHENTNVEKGVIFLDGTKVTHIITSGMYAKLFESSNGNLYMTSHSHGIMMIDGTNVTEIYPASGGKYWGTFFETSNGTIYASGENNVSSSNGLLMIVDNIVTKISETGRYLHFFEDKEGIVYTSAIGSSYGNAGIFKINGSEIENIYETGYNYDLFFLASNGSIYINSTGSSSKGLICIKNGVATLLDYTDSYNYNYKYWYEDVKGNVYAINDYGTSAYALCINDLTLTKLFKGCKYSYFKEVEEGVLVSDTPYVNPNSTIYLLNGTEYSTVKIKEV